MFICLKHMARTTGREVECTNIQLFAGKCFFFSVRFAQQKVRPVETGTSENESRTVIDN